MSYPLLDVDKTAFVKNASPMYRFSILKKFPPIILDFGHSGSCRIMDLGNSDNFTGENNRDLYQQYLRERHERTNLSHQLARCQEECEAYRSASESALIELEQVSTIITDLQQAVEASEDLAIRFSELGESFDQVSQLIFESSVSSQVKAAVFAAGAGRIGQYDSCCWQTLGKGQFRPLAGSDPFLGQAGRVEDVAEWKVELVVADELIHDVVKAMRKAHPYETPAFDVWRLSDLQF